MTREEFKYLQVGDQVRIVSEWNDNSGEASNGEMDHWLGQVMTIRYIDSIEARMEEDIEELCGEGWHWYPAAIESVVTEADKMPPPTDEELALLFY